MMPRGRKRMLSSEAEVSQRKVSGSVLAAINIASLPDEMLIAIFAQLDSVSRKKAERVCSRWLALLRGTASLQKYVKIDRRFLPSDLGDGIYQKLHKAAPQEKLRKAILRFVLGNSVVETLHITDESNPSQPWSTADSVVDKEKAFVKGELFSLAWDLFYDHFYDTVELTRESAPPRLSCIIFEKLVLGGGDVHIYGFFCAGGETCVRIELRNVKVCGLTLMQLSSTEEHPEHHSDRESALTRTVAAATIHCDYESCPTSPVLQLMNALGQEDEPLTSEEEKRFHDIVGPVAETGLLTGAQDRLRDTFVSLFARELTLNDIKDGSTLTPFLKRLVLTGKEAIAYWNDTDSEDENDFDEGAGQELEELP